MGAIGNNFNGYKNFMRINKIINFAYNYLYSYQVWEHWSNIENLDMAPHSGHGPALWTWSHTFIQLIPHDSLTPPPPPPPPLCFQCTNNWLLQ